MAGGKLSPRQKMINLMYLVFIAMLALNMSKEVLSAFGLMNEKFASVNTVQTDQNKKLVSVLEGKAKEDAGRFADKLKKSQEIDKVSSEFYQFLDGVKTEVSKGFESDKSSGKLPYEAMDKSTIDEVWFAGDGYSPRGNAIVAKFSDYLSKMKSILGNDNAYQPIIRDLESKFKTEDVKDGEGVTKKYLDYHYKGFPAIATMAKLTSLQNDVKNIENSALNIFLGAAYKEAASMTNFNAIVVFDKSVVFQGEKVSGKVVLGKYDDKTKPSSFSMSGMNAKIENGQAVFTGVAGSVGEKDVAGQFAFVEDGKTIPIKFEGKYVVVPRPNQALISADKMNVVYRGVDNPISVAIPGISADKVSASAPGMRAAGKQGTYIMRPGSGSAVKITATGKLPDGKSVSSSMEFRIKNIPSPQGRIRGDISAKGSKSNLEVCEVTGVIPDFDFPHTVKVTEFRIKLPGSPSIVCTGGRMSGAAINAIRKCQKGDVATITDVRVIINGEQKSVGSPCSFEIQ